MPRRCDVFALPKLAVVDELVGTTAVVIDVLRASTTIAYALEAGADAVIPCLEIDEARAAAERVASDEVILGGERGGLPIDGFDLGNSPEEYEPHVVGGKTVVFTTTNGTRAMRHVQKADRVLIAAFVNASAVYEALLDAERVAIVCAGTDGQFSTDDILLAGLLVERLERQTGLNYAFNAQALTAKETWLSRFPLPQALGAEPIEPYQLAAELRRSLGGENLVKVGLQDDILAAAQLDRFRGVPELDTACFEIRLNQRWE